MVVVQRSLGPQGTAAREAEYITEERVGKSQVADGADIRRGKHLKQSTVKFPGERHYYESGTC